jgi:hypothetical protein
VSHFVDIEDIERNGSWNKSAKPTAYACHALCRTGRTEHSEFTNEMSNRAHESLQATNNGKARSTLRRLSSLLGTLNSEIWL